MFKIILYNFFFNPDKVKGQPYKPLRSPTYKEAVVVTAASEASKKSAADKARNKLSDSSMRYGGAMTNT